MLDYGAKALIGVLTPQSNTTVEPEFWIMAPFGVNLITARLTSAAETMDARLVDYADRIETTLEQFGGAPLSAVAFACTGSSYLIGNAEEAARRHRAEERFGAPVVSTAQAVIQALRTLGARRIALVSPYPPELTAASAAYWCDAGLEIAETIQIAPPAAGAHPIYGLDAQAVAQALDQRSQPCDAVLLLGTGAPTLGAILMHAERPGPPVLSSMLCLGWLTIARALATPTDRAALMDWISGAPWADRYFARQGRAAPIEGGAPCR